MLKKIGLFLFLFAIPFLAFCQKDNNLSKSGYTSLTVTFSGKYPRDKPISTPSFSNLFSTDAPKDFSVINDSTLFLSFYTAGPTLYYFFYNEGYYRSWLLPNESACLNIHYPDTTQFSMTYDGTFKEIFDNSAKTGEMIREALFSGNYFSRKNSGKYFTANDYRDSILLECERMLSIVSKNAPSPFMKRMFRYEMETTVKLFHLFNQYTARAYREETNDSITIKIPLKRDLSYYDKLEISKYGEGDLLLAPTYDLLKTIRKDSLLNLPNIFEKDPHTYLNKLKSVFDKDGQYDKRKFYEIMIAGAYMDQINAGAVVNEKQKLDVVNFFENKHYSNYILYSSEMNAKNVQSNTNKYHLPFEKDKESVFNEILSRYKDKVVIVDFWATWCGPCLQAFGKIKKVKEHFSKKDDVVFVYLTNDGSDYNQWHQYADYIGGEHYYLHGNQSSIINKSFGIQYIPSYLIFDKKGDLQHKSLGAYMGDDKLKEWIDGALQK